MERKSVFRIYISPNTIFKIVCVLLIFDVSMCSRIPQASQPHILVILADDLGMYSFDVKEMCCTCTVNVSVICDILWLFLRKLPPITLKTTFCDVQTDCAFRNKQTALLRDTQPALFVGQTNCPFWGTNRHTILRDKQPTLWTDKQPVRFEEQTVCPFWGTNNLSFLRDKQSVLFEEQTAYYF